MQPFDPGPSTHPADVPTGIGTINGHAEDDDLRLLVATIDLLAAATYAGLRQEPSEAFWPALHRRHPLLRRTALRLGLEGVPANPYDILPPYVIRVASSYLLAN